MNTSSNSMAALPAGSTDLQPPRPAHVAMPGAVIRPAAAVREFNLSRWFAVGSFLVIALVSLASSAVLSRFLAREMLHHDGREAMQFIQASTVMNRAEPYFSGGPASSATIDAVEAYLTSIQNMPDVLRAQIYSAAGEVLWSSHSAAISQVFGRNAELDEALAGQLSIEADLLESRHYIKPEHVFAAIPEKQFAEYYIPVWNERHDRVIGAVEIYKSPQALFNSIWAGLKLIWLCAMAGGLFTYGVLFFIVHRGHRIIRDQQRQIASNEGFAAVGEISAAVAHNIRNPLAAIRSSAELMITDPDCPASARGFGRDIMSQVDRIESWVVSLLNFARTGTRKPDPVCANQVLQALITNMDDDLLRARVAVQWQLQDSLPPIRADALMLGQIARTLVANAIEAMPAGGTLSIVSQGVRSVAGAAGGRLPGGRGSVPGIQIAISDTGVGIPAAQLRRTFVAPSSSKPHGLGIGLALVARTIERMGGAIVLSSTPGYGTSIRITLPVTIPERNA